MAEQLIQTRFFQRLLEIIVPIASWFLITLLGCFVALLVSFRALRVMDIRERISKLLIGLPVYSKEGKWLGKVEKINKAKNTIAFADSKTKETKEIAKEKFKLSEGRILLSG